MAYHGLLQSDVELNRNLTGKNRVVSPSLLYLHDFMFLCFFFHFLSFFFFLPRRKKFPVLWLIQLEIYTSFLYKFLWTHRDSRMVWIVYKQCVVINKHLCDNKSYYYLSENKAFVANLNDRKVHYARWAKNKSIDQLDVRPLSIPNSTCKTQLTDPQVFCIGKSNMWLFICEC